MEPTDPPRVISLLLFREGVELASSAAPRLAWKTQMGVAGTPVHDLARDGGAGIYGRAGGKVPQDAAIGCIQRKHVRRGSRARHGTGRHHAVGDGRWADVDGAVGILCLP